MVIRSRKKKLLCGISVLALTASFGLSSAVNAAGNDANATTDTNTGSTVTATDVSGLLNDDDAAHAITIDSNAGAISLGAVGATDAISFLASANAGDTATYDITTSGTNNSVTFAGDVHVKLDENIVLNATNTTTVFQGDVTDGTGDVSLIVGSGTSTLTTTFDTAIAGDNLVDMSVNASAAADTITVQVSNTDGTAGNAIAFTQEIGGTQSVDTLQLDANTEATFNGAVTTDTVTSSTTRTTTFNGAVTATSLTAAGDVATGAGAVDINGAVAITGGDLIVGSGDAFLGGASITTDNITLAAGSDVEFDGGAVQTVNGAVDGAGDVTISNNSDVTFEDAVGASTAVGDVVISGGSKATFNSTLNASSLTINDEAQVEDTVTLTGNLDLTNADTITLGEGFGANETVFIVADVDTTNTVIIVPSSGFITGTLILFDSTADASADLANLTVVDTSFTEYTLSANGNDIELTATFRSAEAVAVALSVTTQEADALINGNTAVATGNATLLANLSAALTAGGADAAKAAETIGIQADTLGAGSSAAISTGSQVIGISSDRLASLRDGTQFASAGPTGFSAGDAGANVAAWFKPFGNWIDQDKEVGIAGFDAATYGMAFGADTTVADNSHVGVSFAYANSSVNGDGAGESEADINSYQITLYGDYTDKNYYVEGSIGYAFNDNEVSRVIDFMGTDTVASGDYGSSQFMANVNVGVPQHIEGATYFTPTVGVAWTHVTSEDYTETGAGGLNQSVDIDDMDVVVVSLGAKFHTAVQVGGGRLVPEIHAGINYDLVGDEAAASAAFTGGGAAFTVEGAEVQQFGGGAGLGVTYESGNVWSIGATYDADLKSNYISHSAVFEARFKF
ncbi:MAG: autotransporter domain-containing protein [Pseudomonas marincola]